MIVQIIPVFFLSWVDLVSWCIWLKKRRRKRRQMLCFQQTRLWIFSNSLRGRENYFEIEKVDKLWNQFEKHNLNENFDQEIKQITEMWRHEVSNFTRNVYMYKNSLCLTLSLKASIQYQIFIVHFTLFLRVTNIDLT